MANKNDYVSNERLYLDKEGKVVKADDPNKNTLLVAEGGSLSAEDAEKYGLNNEELEAPAKSKKGAKAEAGDKADTEEADEDGDLESKTVAELREIAEGRGVEVTSSMRKADIIEAIEAAE